MRLALVLPLLLSMAACSRSGSSLSSAKQKQLEQALAAFAEVPPDMHCELAAAALAEIESERLPKPLVKALESIAQVSPDRRAMMIAEGLSESLASVQTMCQGAGIKTMQAMAEQAPDRRLSLIRERCKTDRFELVPHPGPDTDAWRYLLAHVVLSHLREHGGVSAGEKTLIRHLATARARKKP